MKKGLFILTLALLLALLLAGTALAEGDVDPGDAVIYVNGVELEVGEFWKNNDTVNPSGDKDDWNAKFEYDDEEGMYILTLDDAEITEKAFDETDHGDCGILFNGGEELTIVLQGSNMIDVKEADGITVYSYGLNIEGPGSLEITTTDDGYGFGYGIWVNVGNLTIEEADLDIDAGEDGICVYDGKLTAEDTLLEITADVYGIWAYDIIKFVNCRVDVETSADDCAAIFSAYDTDVDDEGIVLEGTVILEGGEIVPVYEGEGFGFLLENGAGGQLNLYGSVTGILIGWTFSGEDEAFGLMDGDVPSISDASTHVILGSEEDASALLNLGIAVLGVGRSFPFVDVPANHWAYQYIFDAVKQNLINGKTADLYGPDASLTYAEAIKLAACIRQLAVDGSVTTEPGIGNPWYAPYVSYAELNSIIAKGQFSDKYNQPVSRYDFALIFAKALPEGYYAAIHNYAAIKDVPAGNAYLPYALKLYNAGIITGQDAAGSFNGQTNIKRSEVAAIVIRMVDSGKRL